MFGYTCTVRLAVVRSRRLPVEFTAVVNTFTVVGSQYLIDGCNLCTTVEDLTANTIV